VDLQPINSMKMVRKLKIDYLTDEMLARLEMKEMREFHLSTIFSTENGRVDELGPDYHLESWMAFINKHSQLEVLHVPYCCLIFELLQITLENLPLLKSLEMNVKVFDFNFNPVEVCDVNPEDTEDTDDYSPDSFDWEEYSDKYKNEQAREIVKLIGEKYDSFEHLKLDFEDDPVRTWVLNYLEKNYPGVKLNK
jgi:hypothetical protein